MRRCGRSVCMSTAKQASNNQGVYSPSSSKKMNQKPSGHNLALPAFGWVRLCLCLLALHPLPLSTLQYTPKNEYYGEEKKEEYYEEPKKDSYYKEEEKKKSYYEAPKKGYYSDEHKEEKVRARRVPSNSTIRGPEVHL